MRKIVVHMQTTLDNRIANGAGGCVIHRYAVNHEATA
jgi:hypothetical protein